MERKLYIYNDSALIKTYDLNTDFGTSIYYRVDKRIELYKYTAENKGKIKSLYRPYFIFEFNDMSETIMNKLLAYEHMLYTFKLEINYKKYDVVMSDHSHSLYHPYKNNFKFNITFKCLTAYDTPDLDTLITYDMLYQDQYFGIANGENFELSFYNTGDLGQIFISLDCDGTFEGQLYSTSTGVYSDLSSYAVFGVSDFYYNSVRNGFNKLVLNNYSGSLITVDKILLYGV